MLTGGFQPDGPKHGLTRQTLIFSVMNLLLRNPPDEYKNWLFSLNWSPSLSMSTISSPEEITMLYTCNHTFPILVTAMFRGSITDFSSSSWGYFVMKTTSLYKFCLNFDRTHYVILYTPCLYLWWSMVFTNERHVWGRELGTRWIHCVKYSSSRESSLAIFFCIEI